MTVMDGDDVAIGSIDGYACRPGVSLTCSDYNFTAACGYTGAYVGRQHHVK